MVKISAITSCFRGERYLAAFLEDVAQQTMFNDLEVVLDHNEPTEAELAAIEQFQRRLPESLCHVVIRPVEPMGTSWNRCIRKAQGEYVTIWNVDDLRTPDSIEQQCRVLDDNPDVGLVYGGHTITKTFGSQLGKPWIPPEFERDAFTRNTHMGPFYMWRKSLCQQAGYFDEQLRSAADFDLAIRLALWTNGKITPGLLGYYLDEGLGRSTTPGDKVALIERTVIALRYGIYDTLDYDLVEEAMRSYRVEEVMLDGQWHPVAQFVPDYRKLLQERDALRVAGVRRYCEQKRFAMRVKNMAYIQLSRLNLLGPARILWRFVTRRGSRKRE